MDSNYTQICEEALWNLYMEESSSEDVLHFLKDASEMAPFGQRLARFISAECGVEQAQAPSCLKERCKEAGIPLNSNTVKNWFSKAGPKKGDHSRDNMLKIAFALGLNPEQTNRLFHKVYLDRGLDPRRPEETAAAFCLRQGQGWTEFQQLVQQLLPAEESPAEHTVLTTLLQKDLDEIQTAEQLRQYVRLHPHNFQIRSRSAENKLKELLTAVKGNKQKTGEVDKELAERARDDSLLEILRGHPQSSIETMVRVITDAAPTQPGKRAILSGSTLPQEIHTNFPEPAVFSKKNPSYEELRKMIVLLASYRLWRQALRNKTTLDFDDYTAAINDQLGDIGMAPLYCGNPFDWLFLFSAIQDNPLDCLRTILRESLDTDI